MGQPGLFLNGNHHQLPEAPPPPDEPPPPEKPPPDHPLPDQPPEVGTTHMPPRRRRPMPPPPPIRREITNMMTRTTMKTMTGSKAVPSSSLTWARRCHSSASPV